MNLDNPTFKGSGVVDAVQGVGLTVSGLASYPTGHFDRGVLTWTAGANAGLESEVRAFTLGATTQALGLWRSPPDPIAVGDQFEVTAGCDKTWATCRAKFGNPDNFRGFPHMPGEAFIAEYARPGDPSQDGGGRFNG